MLDAQPSRLASRAIGMFTGPEDQEISGWAAIIARAQAVKSDHR